MRLAYIVENYGELTETFVTDLIDGLAEAGVKGCVFTDGISHKNIRPAQGFAVQETGFCRRWDRLSLWFGRAGKAMDRNDVRMRIRKWSATRALYPHIRAFAPDVAYIDHGNNAVLAHGTLKALNIPFVVHFHGRDASRLLGFSDYREEIRGVFARAAAIVVPSNHIRRRLILAGCPESKILVIPYGIDLARVPVPDWEARRKGCPSVIHIGRLVEKKSPLSLVHAFSLVRSRVPRARLVIVGDGPLRYETQERVRELGLSESVGMPGALPHERALAELSSHWVYAQHSVTSSGGDQEGFPVSILEGAAAGLPVVATTHSGIPESVKDGETGFLVPEYDYETMAERTVQLLNNPDLAEKMGMAGRHRVEREFPSERRVRDILKILVEASNI